MSWSFPIATVRGTVIRIHVTFFLLLAWIGAMHATRGGMAEALAGIAFIAAVFACVVLHELGHAAAASRYGIATPDITLLPIGGLARLERIPEEPWREIAIALAGPAVNVAICLLLLVVIGAMPAPEEGLAVEDPRTGFLARLFWVNAFLVIFNMIPAFPMDGGRVLRAALTFRMGHRRATHAAATVGQAVAIMLGFAGLFGAPLLIFIALFVWLGAAAESAEVDLRATTRGMLAADAMETRFEALPPEADVAMAAEALLRTPQQDFPVVDGRGRILGLLTRDAIIHTLRQQGPETPVADAMREVPRVPRRMPLQDAIKGLQESPAVAVEDADGRLAGLLTAANLADLLALRG
ncbi:site-2 protease family protein [Roseomonas alkaliterrae]|uniref:Zinc metalloprotease n=1 Tax=Neoroseomonas alkaliterrae TaxID=1452450 RepID=A0A840XQ56_9PROT|nr:site-2 protease family protein [Neoroseomonas alkaliterrae]MBB5690046.1 stage IV sporulation protein FB [Neoroseomonas alkaliterrae]MBR0676366.1 site-2 protease family protein [Neoroseomonas alkaliterrae]